MIMRPFSRHDRAFTLIEVLVAAAILVLVAATAVNLMVSGKMAAKAAWEDTVAVNAAQAVMEELLARRLAGGERQDQPQPFPGASGYTYTYSVDTYQPDDRLVQVRVIIHFQHQGRERQLELVTLKRRG
ncbi:prepilin-type N-terminal cleavage/methylation domain-containing protein [Desulfofundulus thermosubterraneus]|uniref:Prepilin-type N-terminal cleavage/methylation domain-containing protein n=1 Tax=Desulfofundulus thermosubterraneus DSM 16057 TaxID=1121432 RepID=A0A1M6GGQ2_9FIRM|nr:prepilin-type N-terminal cleavage/methylation domain-containing protein [Desulfofundulus thermosubterraneus]SHJ09099.1 prepilin-type N-terminal cleavage/methylation domain-containing protein [Desulfofundulus thermosubterraneus DSM 16057]